MPVLRRPSLLLALCVAGAVLPARAQSLPSPEELAARHDSIIGGRPVLEQHTSIRFAGSFAVPEMGLDAPLEILKRRPDQYLMRTMLGPMGELLTGYDGKNAWAVQPGMGPVVLREGAATQVRDQADFFGDLHDYTRFAKVETLPAEEFSGRRAWPVRMIRATGDTLVEYFDAETGLSAGSRSAVMTPQGRVETQSVVSEYKDFGGLKVATRIEQRTGQVRIVITIADVTFDSVGEKDVEPPEAVRNLIKP